MISIDVIDVIKMSFDVTSFAGSLRSGLPLRLAAMSNRKGRRRFILATKTMALNLAECRTEELKSACV